MYNLKKAFLIGLQITICLFFFIGGAILAGSLFVFGNVIVGFLWLFIYCVIIFTFISYYD